GRCAALTRRGGGARRRLGAASRLARACASSALPSAHVEKEVMRMKKALAGMGVLMLLGMLGTGCEPMGKVREPAQRAETAATRAEDAARRAEASVARREAACARWGAMAEKGRGRK